MAMKEVDLEKLKAQIPERQFDMIAEKNASFYCADYGRARSLWNFTVALMDAEVDDFETAYRIAEESKDLAHLCGFHKWKWRHTRWHEMRWFLTRVWHDRELLSIKPLMKEYIEFICENSKVQWGKFKRPMGLFETGIGIDTEGTYNPRLPWRTPEWLKAHRPAYVPHPRVPLMEFYPYIAKSPTEEHELLLRVDRAVGRSLPPQWRGDFCQDLIVSILSGDLDVGNLHYEMPNYLKRFKREMPSKYKELSIDALIFSHNGGSGPTYADRLVAKPDEDLADEELRGPRWTSRYGDSLNDCETAADLADRLKEAWEVNRLQPDARRTYNEFSKAAHTDRSREREIAKYRQKYGLARTGQVLQRVEPQKDAAWTVETARPEELREEEVA